MTKNYLDNVGARIELIGMPNVLSPFAQFNSASRVAMFNHHMSQAMVLNSPEFNKTFTGVESKMVDYSFNRSQRDHPCEIVAIIPKYDSHMVHVDDCPQFYVITLTKEPNGTRHLDYFTVDKYFMGLNGFGWIPQIENKHRLRKHEWLDPETVITRSPAVNGNQWMAGTNLNVVYGSFAETVEDAFIVSESAAEKLQTTQVAQVVIDCRQDRRPLNLNGDEFTEKFLPDIGQLVRPDGALCAFRPVHWTSFVADADPRALREPLPLQDDIIYIPPGSKIVDLTFNVDRNKIKNNCFNQAIDYTDSNNKCWEAIYAIYLQYKSKFNPTAKMSTLVRMAIYRMLAQNSRDRNLMNEFPKVSKNREIEGVNRQIVDFLQVIVTYTLPRMVRNGDKLSDLQGAKGVIGRVYPDEYMPIDEYGNRADLWIDMTSPVARNNPGQLYEQGINFISGFVQKAIKNTLETKGVDAAFEVMCDYYHDVNPNYEEITRATFKTTHEKKGIVKDAVETSVRVWIPPFLNTLRPAEGDFWNALRNMQKWQKKWGAYPTKIRWKSPQSDGSYKEFVSEEDFVIASKYVLHLHKIPEIFSCGPASVNHIGIPTKSDYNAKHFPVSQNPYRFGEDENRVMAMGADTREVARFQNLVSNSPTGVRIAIEAMLNTDRPTAIARIPISNGDLARTSAVLNLFHSTTATLGVETKQTKIDHMDVPDELAEAIWVTAKEEEDTKQPTKRVTVKKSKLSKLMEELESNANELITAKNDPDRDEEDEELDLEEDGDEDEDDDVLA